MDRPPQVEASLKVLRPDVDGIGVCMIYQVMQVISEVLVEMKLRMRNEDDANSLALDDDLCWCSRLARLSGRSRLS